jgi:hypothetical protein
LVFPFVKERPYPVVIVPVEFIEEEFTFPELVIAPLEIVPILVRLREESITVSAPILRLPL